MDPVNFQFADPNAAIVNGLNMGAGLAQKQQAAIAAQQSQQAALQQQADLRALSMNPNATHADYAAVMTRYPDLAEHLGKAFKVMDEGQQQNTLNFGSRVYAAQLAGNNDLAISLLRDRAKADPAQAQHYNTMADLVEKSPATARTIGALSLAGAMGPDKFAEAFAKFGGEQRASEKAPSELRKSEADATKAEGEAVIKTEEAKAAPQTVLLDLQKKGWDIKKIQEDIDIAKQANRIAAMNAATSRANSDTQRGELTLKVQAAQQKLDDTLREKVANVETARTTADNLLNTVDRLMSNKSLPNVLGSIEGRMPAVFSDEASDAIALIETIKSQAFLAQVPNMKGLGALSNAEGEKLQSALQNLDRKQSEKQFTDNLKEAQRLILKGRKNLVTRYGVPESVPDTPAAAAAAGPSDIEALVKQYTTPAPPRR